jgi:hypothetical protein
LFLCFLNYFIYFPEMISLFIAWFGTFPLFLLTHYTQYTSMSIWKLYWYITMEWYLGKNYTMPAYCYNVFIDTAIVLIWYSHYVCLYFHHACWQLHTACLLLTLLLCLLIQSLCMLALSSRLLTMTCLVFSPWCFFHIFIWVNDSAI